MMTLLDRTMSRMRDIATELRPSILDTLDLPAAIEWQADMFQEQTGIHCTLTSSLGNENFGSELETAVFRIFQESLNNVQRHSRATKVEILLEHKAEKLTLTISDNGNGISPDHMNKPNALGILGMRECALNFHGAISIAGKPETGTIVSISLPVRTFATR